MHLAAASVARDVHLAATTAATGIHYARKKTRYGTDRYRRKNDPLFTHHYVTRAMDLLADAGLIEHTLGQWQTGWESSARATEGGQLARFRAPGPLERGRVGDQCPVPTAATIAGNLPRYRRRRSINALSDRPPRQPSRDPA